MAPAQVARRLVELLDEEGEHPLSRPRAAARRSCAIGLTPGWWSDRRGRGSRSALRTASQGGATTLLADGARAGRDSSCPVPAVRAARARRTRHHSNLVLAAALEDHGRVPSLRACRESCKALWGLEVELDELRPVFDDLLAVGRIKRSNGNYTLSAETTAELMTRLCDSKETERPALDERSRPSAA